jgi:hypothetical protein
LLARAALVQAQLAGYASTKAKIHLVQKVNDYSLEAIEGDSTNSIALAIQGILNYRLTNLNRLERFLANTFFGRLPKTSYKKSVNYLQKAIRYHDTSAYYHFALARTLLAIERQSDAIHSLQIAVSIPPENQLDGYYQRRALKWLDDLENGRKFKLHSK